MLNFYAVAAFVMIMNVSAFVLMCIDVRQARHRKTRIPELVLFLVTGFFGGLGGCLAMYILHHKSRYVRFALGFPLLFLLQIYVILLLINIKVIKLPF